MNTNNHKDIFSNIYDNFGFGSRESRSGPGSELLETAKIREKIVKLIKEKNIKSVVDIPCGDFNWMKEIVDHFESYVGGDIVPQAIKINNEIFSSDRVKFIEFDLINQEIPKCDLLIVRDVIGHQPLSVGLEMVKNILKSDCKYLLSTSWYNLFDRNYHKKHENRTVEFGRFYPVNLMSYPFNFPEPNFIIEEDVQVEDYQNGNRKILAFWNMDEIREKSKVDELKVNKSNVTLVTGIWDIGRSDLTESWKRPYQHYLDKFKMLLDVPENMIIFGEETLREFVFQVRNPMNTQFIVRSLDWFRNNEFFEKIQTIRNNPDWFNQVGWLKDSTQSKLENYNPLVMSKVFLLHDAKLLDKFDSEYLFWIDGGLTNTVHPGYFTHDKVFEKLPKYIDKFSFVCFPYETTSEIHGFEINHLNNLAGERVNKVARGGFFGGPKSSIPEINSIYYNLLLNTLSDGYMGTEESIFSIMSYKHSNLINYFEIEGNGLLGKFFEDLKDDNLIVKSNCPVVLNLDSNKVALYVITFNSPKQFETLIDSMMLYDRDFLLKPEKFLLNNSTDSSYKEEYDRLCKLYDFEHIIPSEGNLGICGGRQFIAEHFQGTDNDFMFFFEDDMFFYNGEEKICKNGFNRYVKNIYNKSLNICKNENFDFLKLNYTEFFGDNGTQWSWYNVPQHIREQYWPGKNRLPQIGLDPNAPKTQFKNISSYDGIPYVSGEIYYCNWPQIVTKEGNKKMFLDTTWAHPFEQTWMSHMYQLVRKNELNPGLLLMTPTSHDRFEHYDSKLRKES